MIRFPRCFEVVIKDDIFNHYGHRAGAGPVLAILEAGKFEERSHFAVADDDFARRARLELDFAHLEAGRQQF
ncbi:MAG: hypothetical protein WBF43_14090, partial [Methylocella sp.]